MSVAFLEIQEYSKIRALIVNHLDMRALVISVIGSLARVEMRARIVPKLSHIVGSLCRTATEFWRYNRIRAPPCFPSVSSSREALEVGLARTHPVLTQFHWAPSARENARFRLPPPCPLSPTLHPRDIAFFSPWKFQDDVN